VAVSTPMFDDLLAGNERHVATTTAVARGSRPRRSLAIVTCMDSRVDPLALFSLEPGEAMVLRNAGARLSDETVADLALAVEKLGVDRVAVMAHTDCQSGATLDDLHADVARAAALDALHGVTFGAFLVDVATDVVTPL
jgi:carbonic anhydrase